MKISVIGLGRVGLPIALTLREKGFEVNGVDVNEELVEKINKKKPPFFEPGLKEKLQKFLVTASTDPSSAKEADVVIICVGTPINANKKPDLTSLKTACKEVSRHVKPGTLFVVKSTVPPGTTRNLFDLVKKISKKEIHFAFVPERLVEGKAFKEISTLPKIIGGVDDKSTEKAAKVFEKIGGEIIRTDCETAEIVKILDNTYRSAKIALANDLALVCEAYGLDYEKVRKIANRGYSRNDLWKAGIWGGPCLTKDPHFIITSKTNPKMILAAMTIHQDLPRYVCKKAKRILGGLDKKRVGILGMAYKKGLDDMRGAPGLAVKGALEASGADVAWYDPYIGGNLDEVLNSDLIIIATDHEEFKDVKFKEGSKILDCKSMFEEIPNVEYHRLGKASKS